MSDQTSRGGDGVIEEHYCESVGCKKWGTLGYSKSKAEKPRWWCGDHYPYWDMFKASDLSPST
ncbi:hypothetical protein AGR1A_Lc80293 [Agrobacterium fabacearum CFBP 5771]|uniref:hypothetical protein n=1 Tax=Agrobacterium tumefaciens TaxID=358 RepID=UPI0009BB5E35|nr:hypothetical protein [Agrobacterium tumefaciens]CVI22765.1 hypothetical protein AGR1A_Lc80293 [Agrobacterium fabacearum CFBP 5771]